MSPVAIRHGGLVKFRLPTEWSHSVSASVDFDPRILQGTGYIAASMAIKTLKLCLVGVSLHLLFAYLRLMIYIYIL